MTPRLRRRALLIGTSTTTTPASTRCRALGPIPRSSTRCWVIRQSVGLRRSGLPTTSPQPGSAPRLPSSSMAARRTSWRFSTSAVTARGSSSPAVSSSSWPLTPTSTTSPAPGSAQALSTSGWRAASLSRRWRYSTAATAAASRWASALSTGRRNPRPQPVSVFR